MKTITLSFLFILIAGTVLAQEPQPSVAKPDTVSPWKHIMIISANMTQVSFTDWVQGGENALAYALFLEGKSTYTHDAIDW